MNWLAETSCSSTFWEKVSIPISPQAHLVQDGVPTIHTFSRTVSVECHKTTFSVLSHYIKFAVIAQMLCSQRLLLSFRSENHLYVVLMFGWASWVRSKCSNLSVTVWRLFRDPVLFVVELRGCLEGLWICVFRIVVGDVCILRRKEHNSLNCIFIIWNVM